MDRRGFLATLLGAVGASTIDGLPAVLGEEVSAAAKNRRPNIIFMLVDDLGWGDFHCYGDSFHETPHIDQLARDGITFTRAYAGAPVCSPSRASILTGQYPARLKLTQWIPGVIYPYKKLVEPAFAEHLQVGTPTIASELKKLGYQTASVGKWHLGGKGFLPEEFGFDVNIGGDNNGHPPPPHGYFGPFPLPALDGYREQDYLTEVLSDKVDRYLESAVSKGPFFLYFAEYAVHLPLQEREGHITKYQQKNGGKAEPDPVYAAMVESVDNAVGRLRAKLNALGIADNTIIVLTSDNGGVGFQGRSLHRIADNGNLHAGKGFLYEGGIREPLLVQWPGVTKPGSVCHEPVFGPDFLPTFLRMAADSTPSSDL